MVVDVDAAFHPHVHGLLACNVDEGQNTVVEEHGADAPVVALYQVLHRITARRRQRCQVHLRLARCQALHAGEQVGDVPVDHHPVTQAARQGGTPRQDDGAAQEDEVSGSHGAQLGTTMGGVTTTTKAGRRLLWTKGSGVRGTRLVSERRVQAVLRFAVRAILGCRTSPSPLTRTRVSLVEFILRPTRRF